MSELLGKSESLESVQPILLAAYPGPTAEEAGHACQGEGRCCGGCRNPKRPLASVDEQTALSSSQDTLRESSEKESSDLPPAQS